MLWSVCVFFAFLEKRRPNRYNSYNFVAPLKMIRNTFCFTFKSSFRSQDILTFSSFRKNKIRLISKFMTSQPG